MKTGPFGACFWRYFYFWCRDSNSWFSSQRTWSWEKKLASDLIKQAAGTPEIDYALRIWLNRLSDGQKPTDNNNNISPPPSAPAVPPGPVPGPFQPPPHPHHHHLYLPHCHQKGFLNLFSHLHQDQIILSVIFIFLHNFKVSATETIKDYLGTYLVHRRKHLLEKRKRLFRKMFRKN